MAIGNFAHRTEFVWMSNFRRKSLLALQLLGRSLGSEQTLPYASGVSFPEKHAEFVRLRYTPMRIGLLCCANSWQNIRCCQPKICHIQVISMLSANERPKYNTNDTATTRKRRAKKTPFKTTQLTSKMYGYGLGVSLCASASVNA